MVQTMERALGQSVKQDAAQELAALRAENARLKAQASARVQGSIKVSEKGAVSVYGMGRFPVTLYAEQWERLFGMAEDVRAFIAEHRSSLSSKADKRAAETSAAS